MYIGEEIIRIRNTPEGEQRNALIQELINKINESNTTEIYVDRYSMAKNRELSQGDDPITHIGPEILAAVLPNTKKITNLFIDRNYIEVNGIKTLVAALPSTEITELSIHGNKIGSNGVKELAIALPTTNITTIYLYNSDMGDEGATALAEALYYAKINIFHLAYNNIKADGIKALMMALPHSQITKFEFLEKDGYQITKELAKVLTDTPITKLHFHLYSDNFLEDGAEDLIKALSNSLIFDAKFVDRFYLHFGQRINQILEENKGKVEEIVKLFKDSTNIIEYGVQDKIQQEESKQQQDEQINTSSKPKDVVFAEIKFNQISSDILSVAHAINYILLQPKAAIEHISQACKNYTKEQISDFIDNIVLNFVSALGDNAVSNLDMLKYLYEEVKNGKLKSDFVKQILEHRGDKFDLEDDKIMHPFVYKLMHEFGINSSLSLGMSPNASELIAKFSKINKESKQLISDKDLGEFYHFLIYLPSTQQDVKVKILENNGKFFMDRYLETPQQKALREDLEKLMLASSAEVGTQTDEKLGEQIQEEQIDQAQVDQIQVQNIAGETSSLLDQ